LALALLVIADDDVKTSSDVMNADPSDNSEGTKETMKIVDDDDDDDDDDKKDDLFLPFGHGIGLPDVEVEIIPMNRPPSPFMHPLPSHLMMPPFHHLPPFMHSTHPMFPHPMEFEMELPHGPHSGVGGLSSLLDSLIPDQAPVHTFPHQGLFQLGPFSSGPFSLPSSHGPFNLPSAHPHSFIDSLLDGILDIPEHVRDHLEERHNTIPDDHEPMMLKMEKKNEFYVVTGWFPGVSKSDISIKVDGSDLKIQGNVTKSEQAEKELGQFADIDEVEESMELPYAPDGRFVKAHFDEKKHTLTVVFPQEKSSDIQLS
jgi:HSP20 family molecular chaperone IbpA